MTSRIFFARSPYSLLAPLALSVAACAGDPPIEDPTLDETGTGGTSTGDEPDSTSTSPPTTGPTTTTLDPSTTTTIDPSTTADPSTTDPSSTSTDPSTTGSTSEDTGNDTTSSTTDGTTTDGTGTTTDGTGTTTDGTTTDGTGTTTDGTTGGDVFELASVWVASNPAALASDAVFGYNPALATQLAKVTPVGDVASIQSIAITGGGDGIITVDLPGAVGGVILDEDMANNPPATGAIGLGQRFIRGPQTDLKTPKGVEADVPGGIFLVADTASADIKAFDFDDDGDVAPLFQVSDLGGSPAIWDMHYEFSTDTLYAAGTNGVVQIYDGFSDDDGQAGPSRSVTPAQANNKISINLHGITVVNDVLYLSDVGDANNAADGQLFVLGNASAIDGVVNVDQRIQGGKLGNPVDLEVIDNGPAGLALHVAEKSNDALIVFTRPLQAPNFSLLGDITRTKLESVARITNNRLMLSSNPAGLDSDAALVQTPTVNNPPAVSSTLNQLGSITSVQSVVLSGAGDGHVSFDGPLVAGGGGAFAIPGLSAKLGDSTASAVAARLWGPQTGIIAPKGIVLDDAEVTLFVADFGAADVKVFDAANLGDTAPLFALGGFGAAPWDVAYDDAADRLFVAGVDGVVRVFDDVLANQGGMPDRTITPTDDQDVKISVNLHGIEYDAAADLLLLSDVGSAMVNSDGQLFLIAAASAADGSVQVAAQVGGGMTKLGNPVDIAYDGANLYVAEKANSFTLRYDNIAALTGANNLAESASIATPAAESVALFFTLVP